MAYTSMISMMGGGSGTAPVPTQTFGASNVIGTPIPVVGDNKGTQNFAGAIGQVSQHHIVIVAVAIIAIGYILFHLNFEK